MARRAWSTAHQPNPKQRGAAERRPLGRCSGPALVQETEAEVSEIHTLPRGQRMGGGGSAVGTTAPARRGCRLFRRLASPRRRCCQALTHQSFKYVQLLRRGGWRQTEARCLSNPRMSCWEQVTAGLGSLGPSLDSPKPHPEGTWEMFGGIERKIQVMPEGYEWRLEAQTL